MTPTQNRCSLGLAVLATAALVAACAPAKGGPGGAAGMKMPPVPVDVAVVEPQTVRDGFHALGTLEADEQVQVTSEVAGIVRSLPFAEGQPIARGGVIAVLDDREARAEADRAKAVLERESLEATRMGKLRERGTVSAQEHERALTNQAVARANLAQAQARLAKTRVLAPFSGVVGRRRISPGAYVKSGDVITDLARLDVLRLSFQAPERFAGRLRVGSRVDVRPAAFPERSLIGEIRVIDPMIEPTTRTLSLLARVPNPGRTIIPGMSADVMATLTVRENALVVPDEAVFAEGNQSFVFKVNPDSSVVRTAVALGLRDSARVEVLSGLVAGDVVVRAGHQKLFPGARVMPMAAQVQP
jgi:membrane fusion protein (multidrug efflux system)